MRSGSTYSLLIALLALPMACHGAGWMESAWTSEYFPTTNDCVVTNLYGVKEVVKIQQMATTNYIPILSSGFSIYSKLPAQTNSEVTYSFTNYTDVSYAGRGTLAQMITNILTTNVYSMTNFYSRGGTNQAVWTTATVSRTGGRYEFTLDADDMRFYDALAAVNERQLAIRGTNATLVAGRFFHDDKPYNVAVIKGWILTNLSFFADLSVATNTANSQYDFMKYLTGTNIYYTYNPTNSQWYTNTSPRTSIPALSITSLLHNSSAPADWFGNMYYKQETGSANKATAFYNKVGILSNENETFWYVVTNTYHRSDFQLYEKDWYGSGEPFGSTITTTVNIIRYPASRWIEYTGSWYVVTNGTTNLVNGYVTNFVYSYEPNEIITNDLWWYDGTMTNVTGTNGQLIVTSRFYSATWTNTSAGVTNTYNDDPVRIGTTDEYGTKYMRNIFSNLVLIIGGAEWETTNALQVSAICDLEQIIEYNGPLVDDGYYASFFEPIHLSGLFTNNLYATNTISDRPSKELYEVDTFTSFQLIDTTVRLAVSNSVYDQALERVCAPVIETYSYSYFGYYSMSISASHIYYQDGTYYESADGIKPVESVPDNGCYNYITVSNDVDPLIFTSLVATITIDDDNIGFRSFSPTNRYVNFDTNHEYTVSISSNIYYPIWYCINQLEYNKRFYSMNFGESTSLTNGGIPESAFVTVANGYISEILQAECSEGRTNDCRWISGDTWGLYGRYENPPDGDIQLLWDVLSVRNYAVPNGFKYY